MMYYLLNTQCIRCIYDYGDDLDFSNLKCVIDDNGQILFDVHYAEFMYKLKKYKGRGRNFFAFKVNNSKNNNLLFFAKYIENDGIYLSNPPRYNTRMAKCINLKKGEYKISIIQRKRSKNIFYV